MKEFDRTPVEMFEGTLLELDIPASMERRLQRLRSATQAGATLPP